MENRTEFTPARQNGTIFQSVGITALLLASGYYFYLALQVQVGSRILLYLALFVLLFAPVPILAYRLYCLLGASYRLERDGLRLHWGLRTEDIPIAEVEWIRPAGDYGSLVAPPGEHGTAHLPLPWLHWPGSIRGAREVEGLGTIEYFASSPGSILLVGTAKRIYAISPANPVQFVKAFNRFAELGSLTPIQPRSVYPSVVVGRLWSDPAARYLLLAGVVLSAALFLWVILAIPTRAEIQLGFVPSSTPSEPSPSERLLLLPILDGFAFIADLLLGLYFFRRTQSRVLAYLLWGAGALVPALFLAGVGFILKG